MSSVTVITSIIVLLAALVCYAFIAQTVSQKKQQRERLLMALKARVRNFKFMLSGFPAGFLPKELTLLVQRSLMQLLEQLTKLEPNANHKQELQAVAQQMAETQRQPPPATSQSVQIVDNPQRVREIKAGLEELYKFVFHLEGKRLLTRAQANIHRAMIRNLVLLLTVDSYVLHGRIAREKEKPRLAVHYFDLALKLMLKERANGQFEGRINQLRAAIADLDGGLLQDTPQASKDQPDDSDQAGINDEWDKFSQEQTWKKKQIYD
jgi:hypothetical protein